ncbi:hypothetical protein BC835DRAFT_559624 [Cytidiella melzeri]|nr:hypothetical protein BC835DRAFT_559624 [Cytidiella melzeri]
MGATDEKDIDPTFASLPFRLRKRIDRALDAACSDDTGRSRKRRRGASGSKPSTMNTTPLGEPPTAGGFLLDDVEQSMGGGFIPEDAASSAAGGFVVPPSDSVSTDDSMEEIQKAYIPFRLIPRALQLLDLQPDDEDVLDVFRNAASGWGTAGENLRSKVNSENELLVSRKDWRAVCAALFDTSALDEEGELQEDEAMNEEEEEESAGSEEEYTESGGMSDEVAEEEDSGDDYQEGGFVRSTPQRKSTGKGKTKATAAARRTRSRKASYSSASSDGFGETTLTRLTPRQKAECLRMFAMFFPGVADSEVQGKSIMIKDIARVAELLKERITAEEIVEMLEAFSTSPDKSMSLSDFETMMVAAKMA